MFFAWFHILFARLNGTHTWCEGMHATCMGTITNMHVSMESMYSAWTLLQVDKEYMHVSKKSWAWFYGTHVRPWFEAMLM